MIPTKALYKIVREFIPDVIETYEDSYATRLKVQKLIYLFEEFRKKDSYGFSWYLAGPYSSVLTHQVYESLLKETNESIEQWDKLQFSDTVSQIVNNLKEFFNDAKEKNNSLSDTRMWELLATILYINNNNSFDSVSSEEEKFEKLKNKLLANKTHFRDTANLDDIVKLVINTYSTVE